MFISISVSSTASCRIWHGRSSRPEPRVGACRCKHASTCSCCLQTMKDAHALRTACTWPREASHQVLKARLEDDVGLVIAPWR